MNSTIVNSNVNSSTSTTTSTTRILSPTSSSSSSSSAQDPQDPMIDDTESSQFSYNEHSFNSSIFVHESTQKKAFTKWLNSHLSKKGYPPIVDLYTDLRDGAILVALLDVLCNCKIKLERGRLRVHHLNNVARVLQVFNEHQVKIVNISTNDIVDGNPKLTLGLVWCIILHWQVNILSIATVGRQTTASSFPATLDETTLTEVEAPVSGSSIPICAFPVTTAGSASPSSLPTIVRPRNLSSQLNSLPESFSTSSTSIAFSSRIPSISSPLSSGSSPSSSAFTPVSSSSSNFRFCSTYASSYSSPHSPTSPTLSSASHQFIRPVLFSHSSNGNQGNNSLSQKASSGLPGPSGHHLNTTTTTTTSVSIQSTSKPSPPPVTMSQNDLEKKLLTWCRESTTNYEGVQINNFTTSWSSGLAFNALIHHFRPKLFNYGEVLGLESNETRLKHAFDLAEKHLGIEKILDPEDFNTPRPDKKSVMIYVMCFFKLFETSNESSSSAVSAIPEHTVSSKNETSSPASFSSPTQPSGSSSSNIPEYSSRIKSKTSSFMSTPTKRSSPTPESPVLFSPKSISSDNQVVLKSSSSPQSSSSSPSSSTTGTKMKRPSNIPVPSYSRSPSSKGSKSSKKSSTPSSPSTTSTSSSSSSTGQQQQQQVTTPTSVSSNVPASLDPNLVSDIEVILTWILGAEEKIKSAIEEDYRRFALRKQSAASDLVDTSVITSSTAFDQAQSEMRHKRVMATIKAAEYAKERFEAHEEFMRELATYCEKTILIFERGKQLIYWNSASSPTSKLSSWSMIPHTPTSTSSSSSLSSPNNKSSTSDLKGPSISKQEVAMQMKLLDEHFNQLNNHSTNHQHYLHKMLIEAQNSQLEELRTLMTQTEGRIAVIIPQSCTEVPSDYAALEAQLDDFDQLQEAIIAEQSLLDLISKFVIIDIEDGTTLQIDNSSTFVDQLEALNERWTNACQITNDRGAFLYDLRDCWEEFSVEETRLLDWFGRLERRLNEMDNSIDELEEEDNSGRYLSSQNRNQLSPAQIRNEHQFLQDIARRLERMRYDIFYGTDRSQKLVDEELAEEQSSPLSKITQATYALLNKYGERGICSKVMKSIEQIRNRWETLAGRIEHSEQLVKTRLESYPKIDHSSKATSSSVADSTKSTPSSHSSVNTRSSNKGPQSQQGQIKSAKRRKVDLCGVRDWQNLLDQIVQWIDTNETNLLRLSVSSDLYDPNSELLNPKSGLLQLVDCSSQITNLADCFQAYQILVNQLDDSSNSVLLIRKLFNSPRNDGDSSGDSGTADFELDKLDTFQAGIKDRTKDFVDLMDRGQKIVDDFKNANEQYRSIQIVLDSLNQKWTTLQFGVDRCRTYAEVWSALSVMKTETIGMRQILDKYQKRFISFDKTLSSNNLQRSTNDLESLSQHVEFCKISIDGQWAKVKEFIHKLNQLYEKVPLLFLLFSPLGDQIEDLKQLKKLKICDSSSTTQQPPQPIEIGQCQLECFQLSANIYEFMQSWLLTSQTVSFLMEKVENQLKQQQQQQKPNDNDEVFEKEEKIVEEINLDRTDNIISYTETEMEDSNSESKFSTDKLLNAIETLNDWLVNVIEMVDNYDDEDDDEEDYDEAAEEDDEEEGVQVVSSQQNDDVGSGEKSKSKRMPGSKLCSLAHLANEIDKRVDELADLQKLVDAEQENYYYCCRSVADIVFSHNDDNADSLTNLPDIEKQLSELEVTKELSFSPSTHKLIEQIKLLIKRWNLAFSKFHMWIEQLEEISPSTTLLEAEFAQIHRWVEEAVSFLNQAIAIGDMEALSDQLCECERLKNYMEQSEKQSFQNILSTAQAAVEILLGKKNNPDQVPVIRKIRTTWQDLRERTSTKLELLRRAQDLTRKFRKSLDDFDQWQEMFETKIEQQQQKTIDVISDKRSTSSLSSDQDHQLMTLTEQQIRQLNWPKQMLHELTRKRAEYDQIVVGKNGNSILASILSLFQTTESHRIRAFDKLKYRATESIPARFDSIKKKLLERSNGVESLLGGISQLVQLLQEEENFLKKLCSNLKISTLSGAELTRAEFTTELEQFHDSEEVELSLNQLNRTLFETLTGPERLARIEQIRLLLEQYQKLPTSGDSTSSSSSSSSSGPNNRSIINFYAIQSDKYTSLLEEEAKIRSNIEKKKQLLEEFVVDLKDCEEQICSMQKWLKEFGKHLDSKLKQERSTTDKLLQSEREQLESKQNQLNLIEQHFMERFESNHYTAAIKRLETKVKFVQQIFNEIKRKLDKSFTASSVPTSPTSKNAPSIAANQLESKLIHLEKALPDLGQLINEMEITLLDDSEQIPVQLEKIIEQVCLVYEAGLNDFKQKLIKEFGGSTNSTVRSQLTDQQRDRVANLDTAWDALVKALAFRRNLIVELIELCSNINQKLIDYDQQCHRYLLCKSKITEENEEEEEDQVDQTEHSISSIEIRNKQQQEMIEKELFEIKQNCHEILTEICNRKQRLDIHCIRHTDDLLGIEEVCARYDEIITDIAERYADSDNETDDEEDDDDDEEENEQYSHMGENPNNYILMASNESRQSLESTAPPLEQKQQQLQTITEEVNSECLVNVNEANDEDNRSEQQQPAPSIPPPSTPKEEEEEEVKFDDLETSVDQPTTDSTVVATIQPGLIQSIPDGAAGGQQDPHYSQLVQQIVTIQRRIPKYFFRPYLRYLSRLEAKINLIFERRISFDLATTTSTSTSTSHSKLPISLVDEELHSLGKSINEVRIEYETILCASTACGLLPVANFYQLNQSLLSLPVNDEDGAGAGAAGVGGGQQLDKLLNLGQGSLERKNGVKVRKDNNNLDLDLDDPNEASEEEINDFKQLLESNRPEQQQQQQQSTNRFDWQPYNEQVCQSIDSISDKFGKSWNVLLSLHRHWCIIREDIGKFNSEILRLAAWFENVELQLANGRLTSLVLTSSVDEEHSLGGASGFVGSFSLDVSDLNMLVVAKTQKLLVTQLKEHLPDYSKLQVLYNRLLVCFSSESTEPLSPEDMALFDARNHIKHEMDRASFRWNLIVCELAWRRECLLGLASDTLKSVTVGGYPYKPGNDPEFDKQLEEIRRAEGAPKNPKESGSCFQLAQLQKWQKDTQMALDKIRIDYCFSGIDTARLAYSKLKEFEQDLSRQFLNWMLVTQEPLCSYFKQQQRIPENDRKSLEIAFSKVSTDLFQVCYFIEVYITCYNYIVQLTKFEFEWLLTSHEHLNTIDDYLQTSCTAADFVAAGTLPENNSGTDNSDNSNAAEPNSASSVQGMPLESIIFVENLKNSLISHEQNIEQITTILKELHRHASQLNIQIDLVPFLTEFGRLNNLRTYLMSRLRSQGLTAWSALHYLLKKAFIRLKTYQEQRENSYHSNSRNSRSHSKKHSAQQLHPDQHHNIQQSAAHNLARHIAELRNYFTVCQTEFNRWLAIETHILGILCARSMKTPLSVDNLTSGSGRIQPSKVLKLTIRRCEDFFTEFSFALTILTQIWSELENETIVTVAVGASVALSSGSLIRKQPQQQPAPESPANSTSSTSHRRSRRSQFQQFQRVPSPSEVVNENEFSRVNDGGVQQTEQFSNNFDTVSSTSSSNRATQQNNKQHKFDTLESSSGVSGRGAAPTSTTTTTTSATSSLLPLNTFWYDLIQQEIMERIRDLQREHQKRAFQQLLATQQQNQQQQQQQKLPAKTSLKSPSATLAAAQRQQQHAATPTTTNASGTSISATKTTTTNKSDQNSANNLYDTVADAFDSDPSYHRPDLPELSNANLDLQRNEIEQWLNNMEKRFTEFIAEYSPKKQHQGARSNTTERTSYRDHQRDDKLMGNNTDQASLKKQLAIISNYQTEFNQNASKLQALSNAVDARIASLAPKGSDISKSNISMPYYDHLIELRKHADDMQIRINDLYLSIKCKLRSLQELFSVGPTSSSRINIMSMVNGATSGIDLEFATSSLNKKSSKSLFSAPPNSESNSGLGGGGGGESMSSPMVMGSHGSSSSHGLHAGSAAGITGQQSSVGSYNLHEQSEKRFAKWLGEIEQSLDFIEKRLAAESALSNGHGGSNGHHDQNQDQDDGPLYSNVSEMQQMHMNYFEKVKIMQREIEQKRADHRALMEPLENESESNESSRRDTSSTGKRSFDPALQRYRVRMEQLNNHWNNVRLRVLTLRSRLESNAIYSNGTTTTTPVVNQGPPAPSASFYSVNGFGGLDEAIAASAIAFNSAGSERATQLLLSLRELIEWIIKRQTEFESQQQHQQQQQQYQQYQVRPNLPLDIANVLQQKASLTQLRSQLGDKRPIIDSSLLACHNFLRRLAVKRSQDVHQARITGKLPSSVSIASSIGTMSTSATADLDRLQQVRQHKQAELIELELAISREMQKLLEIWNSLQIEVEMRLQRLDDAHLRLTDLQRAMEDLGAKLHEAEYAKSQWTPIGEIPFDQMPQQKALLKNFGQLYLAPITRDTIKVNELAARLTGRNVPLSHVNLKSLEEITTRARMLQMAVDERSRELNQAVHDHGTAQQHFLTEAVEEPWERAVTANKLPCYINRTTESVYLLSPKYTEIVQSLSSFNYVRHSAYRTAMKLRKLQSLLGLDQVTFDILTAAFEQHNLGPNATPGKQPPPSVSVNQNDKTNGDESAADDAGNPQPLTENLPYELRFIGVPEIVSCLKTIFESVSSAADGATATAAPGSGGVSVSGSGSDKQTLTNDQISTSKNGTASSSSGTTSTSLINVPLYVDLCFNLVLALYDASSRSGYIRQFSFQVALVLLSRISLDQKYLYLFNLIADENGRADERRLGLLLYDCLRLPKLLGEVAAFGGTNIEPSVRSCLEMADSPMEGITSNQLLKWVHAEPQSLVWLLVLHRLRLAEKSRHPAKCNLCRAYPIVGFRYRCLKCFNFDLCQDCFLADKTAKKHKSTHPMQEYCVATTSGEDMRDFTRILRNKFKSGRYFERHQALGYLPVQSLHEGDRLEDSPSFVQQGSYSHAPSSNTTPVHTLLYPQRAASPGSLTQRDLEFILESRLVDRSMSTISSTGYRGVRPAPLQTASVEHHRSQHASPMMPSRNLGKTPTSPVNQSSDEVHNRLGHYASRLAEAELVRSESMRGSGRSRARSSSTSQPRQPQHSSQPGQSVDQHSSLTNQTDKSHRHPAGHSTLDNKPGSNNALYLNSDNANDQYDLVQSPTQLLSKIAADQRSELEQIIQRLEEENRLLVTEYNQLKTDTDPDFAESVKNGRSAGSGQDESDHHNKSNVYSRNDRTNQFNDNKSSESSTVYENFAHSHNRHSTNNKHRTNHHHHNHHHRSSLSNGSSSSLVDHHSDSDHDNQPPTTNGGTIPPYLLEESRRLRENKVRLENRKAELENCNHSLETQLSQFKQYINSSGSLDEMTKRKLALSILEAKKMLDSKHSQQQHPTSQSDNLQDDDDDVDNIYGPRARIQHHQSSKSGSKPLPPLPPGPRPRRKSSTDKRITGEDDNLDVDDSFRRLIEAEPKWLRSTNSTSGTTKNGSTNGQQKQQKQQPEHSSTTSQSNRSAAAPVMLHNAAESLVDAFGASDLDDLDESESNSISYTNGTNGNSRHGYSGSGGRNNNSATSTNYFNNNSNKK